MVWIRRGVDWRPNREIDEAVRRIEKLGVDVFITSGRDGFHNPGSKHAQGDAFDMRPWPLTSGKTIGHVRDAIGKNYDVVDEKDHWHIELEVR